MTFIDRDIIDFFLPVEKKKKNDKRHFMMIKREFLTLMYFQLNDCIQYRLFYSIIIKEKMFCN